MRQIIAAPGTSGGGGGTPDPDSVGTLELKNDAVTNAKLANMANNTVKGNASGSTGNPQDLDIIVSTALSGADDDNVPSTAAVKTYVDNKTNLLTGKDPVLVVASTNRTLSGEQTIDGQLTSGSRVLLIGQTAPAENGIYVTAAGAWSRSADMDAGAEFPGATMWVLAGSSLIGRRYTCTNPTAPTLGSTSIAFVQSAGSGLYSADEVTLTQTSGIFSIKNRGVGFPEFVAATAQYGFVGRSSSGTGSFQEVPGTAAGFALMTAADATAQQTALSLVPGTDVQEQNARLEDIADNLSAASGAVEKTGANTFGTFTVTTAAKSVLDDTTTGAMLTTLGFSANAQTMAGHTFSQMRTDLTLVPGTDVQAQNARLQDIATNLTGTDGAVEKTGANTFGTFTVTSAAKTILDDATVGDILTTLGASANGQTLLGHTFSQMRTDLTLVPGTDVQTQNARLQDIATNLSATSGAVEKTGANTFGTYTVTTAAKTILDDTTVGAILTTLGASADGQTLLGHTFSQMRTDLTLVPGTDVQAQNARLQDIATNLSAASGAIEKTGANTFGTYTVTIAAKTVLDDTTTGAMLTTLGFSANAQSFNLAANYAAMRALLVYPASEITFSPTGTIAATNVQAAIAEAALEAAQLSASNTFTGATFTINRNSTTVAVASAADPSVQIISSDGASGRLDIASASGSSFGGRRWNGTLSGTPTGIVAGDVLCIFGGGGYGATGFIAGYPAQFRMVGDGTWTNSSAPTRLEVRSTRSGSITNTLDWTFGSDGCLFYGAGSTTGVAQSINAAALYEAGVALTSKYARLASANIFTAAQTINAGSGLGPGSAGLTLRSDSGGNFGAALVTYHNTASPAVSDIPFIQQVYGKNSAAADYAFAQFFVILDNVTAGAEAGHYQYQVSKAGAIQNVLSIGDGVYTDLLTGQGNGTINAGRLYQNNIPIDSSTTVNTDADFTVIVGTSSRHQHHTGTLTAGRTVTLSVSGVTVGDDFTFARVGAGAFNLSIGGLKNLVQNTWCKVKYTAAGWALIAYGAL